jgi:putative oxygen-independent coproporphyrinogen III oxidase
MTAPRERRMTDAGSPETRSTAERAGLYVHVPFCLTRCGYCDFNAYAGLGHLSGRYVRALVREAELNAQDWAGVPFASIFFGGGTPTTVPSRELVNLIDHVRGVLAVGDDAEVTVEANPDTVDRDSLAALLAGGVNRLSMGAQSFDPAVLAALERVHQPESVRRAFADARAAGFDDVNVDLIFGAHGETLDSWRRTLEEVLALGPEHVSAYALTVEPATPLGRAVDSGATPPPDPDLQADMFDLACGLLGAAGYLHYEVSNWALPGHECRHNLGYWERRPYLGLGAGAHSWRAGRRWWNVRPPQQYLDTVESGTLPLGGEERLDADAVRLESFLLGLRTAAGVPSDDVDRDRAAPFLDEGLLAERDGRLVLTERGLFLANDVVLSLAG